MNGWTYPRNIAHRKFHFLEAGAERCLCGRWPALALFEEREDRRRRVGTDSAACIEAWCAKYEPKQKVFVRQ